MSEVLDYVVIQQVYVGLSSDVFQRIAKDLKGGIAVNRGFSWRKDRISLEVSTEKFCDSRFSILSPWSTVDCSTASVIAIFAQEARWKL